MDFATLTTVLIDWAVRIGSTVNDLPGSVAFALGLFTWFLVEQILRKVMTYLRWVVLVGVLAGLGVSLPYLGSLILERGDTPEVTGS